MSSMKFDFDTDAGLKKIYGTYTGQLNQWVEGGEPPKLAMQEIRCAMEQQREHWKRSGLQVHQKIKGIKGASREVPAVSYQDRMFVNHIVSSAKMITTTIRDSGGEIYRWTGEAGLSVVIQELKKNTQPPQDMASSCPHCGAPATLAQLENGCPFCDTHFVMEELYPKVTNQFTMRDSQDVKQDLWLLPLFLAVMIGLAFTVMPEEFRSRGIPEAYSRVMGVPASLIAGLILWGVCKALGIFKMAKDLRGGGKLIRSLQFRHQIKKLDPEFSTEYFRDRAMNLFRMMAYSEDPGVYTACECRRPDSWENVLDASLYNFGVDKYRINGNECSVSITLYLDALIYKQGKVKYKGKKVRMTLRKIITEPTNLGFSVKAVSCPSCAGSFDAEKVKCCPYCGKEYDLVQHDWVVTEIR